MLTDEQRWQVFEVLEQFADVDEPTADHIRARCRLHKRDVSDHLLRLTCHAILVLRNDRDFYRSDSCLEPKNAAKFLRTANLAHTPWSVDLLRYLHSTRFDDPPRRPGVLAADTDPTLPENETAPKENAMMTIETKTFVNDVDASTLTDTQLFDAIAQAEAAIAAKEAIKNKPEKLRAEIDRLNKYIADLVAYIDNR